MKIKFWHHNHCVVTKQKGDKPIYSESVFFYRVKEALNKLGKAQFIKKLMVKDGHLTDSDRYYVRSRAGSPKMLGIAWDRHAIEYAYKEYNEDGHVTLTVYNLGAAL